MSSLMALGMIAAFSPAFAQSPSHDAGVAAPNAAVVTLPQDQWRAAGITLAPVTRAPFENTLRLTGKISLNEDRVAHIYSLVEGTVSDVPVTLGQRVQTDDLLAVIHSREVGEAKLQLYQDRLQVELANIQHQMQTKVAGNASELLDALRNNTGIDEIERQFRDRPMGDFRERVVAAYAAYLKSAADVVRLEGISETGAVSGKQLLTARANRNADQATFQSRIEQIQHELHTSTVMSSQAVKMAEAKALVSATSLRILNVPANEIDHIDPVNQGETISHYAIRAPFDGTILTKDVVLSEQVRPDVLLFSIADLSTVWVTANIYEEHLPLLDSFKNQTVKLRNDALPEQSFTAKVFYTGDVMDETTRTISLRAIADNSGHHLKPGMFINIELPTSQPTASVLIPSSAVQEHAGQTFVFVLNGTNDFHRRDVKLGLANESSVVVEQGLHDGESIVVQGGFILKSQLLADLMGEE
ncbi:efflux RND transporter periplasmic adaptor subunit [Allorhodopirellula heiligendammensis]|uniref:efflux RND transporter periplasmic adaptor subunit n=1 Tax=Allorhodopirellula heiligendammensis TaxID=2714739 RepID=UPI002660287C|nr:efflux RND transporter periplasmic adaptor subunit [Allorhodopirellula heiligendammensis]